MRSNARRLCIAALLTLGGVACQGVPAAAAPATQAAQPAPSAQAACAQAETPTALSGYCGLPPDVREFVDNRDLCDHWRGEPWVTDDEVADDEDKAQARERREQITKEANASCVGTDAALARLKQAYAGDPRILEVLNGYEADIEFGE